jgi:hypothetical protein
LRIHNTDIGITITFDPSWFFRLFVRQLLRKNVTMQLEHFLARDLRQVDILIVKLLHAHRLFISAPDQIHFPNVRSLFWGHPWTIHSPKVFHWRIGDPKINNIVWKVLATFIRVVVFSIARFFYVIAKFFYRVGFLKK